MIQTKNVAVQTPEINSNIESRLGALKSSGRPMPESTRSYFESRFGHDFSNVRIQSDSGASDLASSINAKAFTIGRNIFFGKNQYAPETNEGKRLFAHELTHVIQQRRTFAGCKDIQCKETTEEKLKSPRFQGDPILNLVMENLITLQKDKRGPQINRAVKKIQLALIDAGFPLLQYGPDGLFGKETEQAVRDFQMFKGLSKDQQDGKVGPITLGLLDKHFDKGEMPRPLPPDVLSGPLIHFDVVTPVSADYIVPEPFLIQAGDRITLSGPMYSAQAEVVTNCTDLLEKKKWDIGHVQDITGSAVRGIYENNEKACFTVPLPIRDSFKGEEPLFPWYRQSLVTPAMTDQPVNVAIEDAPDVTFLMQQNGSPLRRIEREFKAIDWVTARNRNTGETRFLHNIRWGFHWMAEIVPITIDDSSPPSPKGSNDQITQGHGEGATRPSMTEKVYNSEAKLDSNCG